MCLPMVGAAWPGDIVLCSSIRHFFHVVPLSTQGRVVRKPVNVDTGLNVNWSIKVSYFKMSFTSNVWCILRLLQLKTEGQTI